MHFMSVVLNQVETAPPSFLYQFIRVTEQKFESISALHFSTVLLLLTRTAKPDSNFVALVNRAFLIAGNKTTALARLHQVLIACSVVPKLIQGKYMGQHAELMHPFLSSALPSLYAAGLRMFEEGARVYPPERCVVGLRVAIEIIADRFVRMASFPVIPDLQFRAIMSVLLKPKVPIIHGQIFKLMPVKFVLPESHPGYLSSIRVWPTVVRMITKVIDTYKRVMQFSDSLLVTVPGFEIGVRALNEKWPRLSIKERTGRLLPLFHEWLAAAIQYCDYRILGMIRQWYDLSMNFEPGIVDSVSRGLIRGIKSFWVVYLNIL
jgi:hypothetical protein